MGLFSRVKKGVKRIGSRVKSGVKRTVSKVRAGVKVAAKTGLDIAKKAASAIEAGTKLVKDVIKKAEGTVIGKIAIDLLRDTPIEKLLKKGDKMAQTLKGFLDKAITKMEKIENLADAKPEEIINAAKGEFDKLDGEAKDRAQNFVTTVVRKAPKTAVAA